MQLVSVIPIQKGIPFDSLTYYSAEPLPVGFLVKIPVQSREVLGCVVSSKPLSDAKMDVKTSLFSLKKIKQIIGPGSIDETFLSAATRTARKSFIPLGSLLGELITESAFEQQQYITRAAGEKNSTAGTVLVQGTTETRLDGYKAVIRATLGKKQSVLFIAPTVAKVNSWYGTLAKGIEKRSHILHHERSKTDQKRTFRDLFQTEDGVLLVTTPHFAALPWLWPTVVILDEPSHIGWTSRSRFAVDYLDFFISLARTRGTELHIGDRVLPFPLIWEEEKNSRSLFPRRYAPERLQIIDTSERPFEALPKELIELARHADATGKQLFIYAERKGIAPYSVCDTCKTVVCCNECQTALVLKYVPTTKGKERSFICPECGHREPASYLCAHCGSWNISACEIGIDATIDTLRALALSTPILRIESEQGTDDEIEKTLAITGPRIIVGTERAFSFLETIDFSAVPHFDRLIARTAIDSSERVLRLLFTLDTLTTDAVVAFTKNPKQGLLTAVTKKELGKYVEAEGAIAQVLGYPPFGILLKISIRTLTTEKESAIKLVTLACKPLEAFHVSTRRTQAGSAYVILVFVVKAGKSFFESHLGHYERFLENLSQLPFKAVVENNPKNLF